MLSIARLSLFALLLTSSTLASSHSHLRHKRHNRKHFDIAERHSEAGVAERDEQLLRKDLGEELVVRDVHNNTLTKRAFQGRGTFYYTGLGACGQYSKDSDYMVALNSAQYGGGYPGPQCFKMITVQANGVTVGGVQILDECPTCDYGGLDLSPALFRRFADEGAGVISLTWWFDGDAPQPEPTTQPAPTTQAPTSVWVAPSSTEQWHAPSSTTQWTPSPTPSPPAPSSTSTSIWVAPSSSTTIMSSITSSASASASSSGFVHLFNSTNPYIIASEVSSASASATASAGVDVSVNTPLIAEAANLQAINGLVAAYGQIIVVGGGAQAART